MADMHPQAAVTYASYLKVDELLSLQQPRSEGPEHDEMLFIVIHQVYELWFKQLLHEARLLQKSLEEGDTPTATRPTPPAPSDGSSPSSRWPSPRST